MKFRDLKAEEIDVRVGNIINTPKWQGYSLLLYKDARCDMAILDEQVGVENWQREHYEVKGNLYCRVGIYSETRKEWIWKSDCGTESNQEAVKGESSDSFKRACVNWGIGRELYTAPNNMLIQCELENGKIPSREKYRRFKVVYFHCKDKVIDGIEIIDAKTGEVVYSKKPRLPEQTDVRV